MSVKTIFIPCCISMPPEEAFLARATGDMAKYKSQLQQEAESAQADLNDLLEDNYTVITSHLLEAGRQTTLMLVLYKRD